MAINVAFKNVPWAEIAYIGDTRLLDYLADDIDWAAFRGLKITRGSQLERAERLQPSDIHIVEAIAEWSFDPAAVCSLGNAGLGGLNIVDVLRWDPIFLLGFDAYGNRGDGKMANYHDHYPRNWAKPENFSRIKFQRIFDQVKNKIVAKVYNCSPSSALECFEKITFDEAEELCRSLSRHSGKHSSLLPGSSP